MVSKALLPMGSITLFVLKGEASAFVYLKPSKELKHMFFKEVY